MPRPWILEKLGRRPYTEVWDYQKRLAAEKIARRQTPDYLLLTEHPPVYTLGTGSSLEFLRFDPQGSGHEIHRTERGGEVTYHCPGQLVGYPVLDLNHYQRDLHWYLRQLETVLLTALASQGLNAQRREGLTGIWLNGVKVGAIGIKVSRWVAYHGFSLNVCPDLGGFERIVPCGLQGYAVGALNQALPDITLPQMEEAVINAFQSVFDVHWLKDAGALGLGAAGERD
jgi:lipoyl(octanoyl) transferase